MMSESEALTEGGLGMLGGLPSHNGKSVYLFEVSHEVAKCALPPFFLF